MTKQTAARAEKFPGRLGASARGHAGSPAPRFRIADYAVLLKPRVMSLVVFTAITGLLLAPNPPGSLSPQTGFFAIHCNAHGAGPQHEQMVGHGLKRLPELDSAGSTFAVADTR